MPNDVDICVNKVLTKYLVLQKGFLMNFVYEEPFSFFLSVDKKGDSV